METHIGKLHNFSRPYYIEDAIRSQANTISTFSQYMTINFYIIETPKDNEARNSKGHLRIKPKKHYYALISKQFHCPQQSLLEGPCDS